MILCCGAGLQFHQVAVRSHFHSVLRPRRWWIVAVQPAFFHFYHSVSYSSFLIPPPSFYSLSILTIYTFPHYHSLSLSLSSPNSAALLSHNPTAQTMSLLLVPTRSTLAPSPSAPSLQHKPHTWGFRSRAPLSIADENENDFPSLHLHKLHSPPPSPLKRKRLPSFFRSVTNSRV